MPVDCRNNLKLVIQRISLENADLQQAPSSWLFVFQLHHRVAPHFGAASPAGVMNTDNRDKATLLICSAVKEKKAVEQWKTYR